MTVAATVPTGFVGNLTAEQETQLRQLWALVLQTLDTATTTTTTNNNTSRRTDLGDEDENENSPPTQQTPLGATELRDSWLHMAKQESPDALLLRFLRARGWDAERAHAMLADALAWRAREQRVDEDVVPKGEPWCAAQLSRDGDGDEGAREYLDQVRCGKVYLRGRDRRGRPVGYVHLALHQPGAQSGAAVEKLVVNTIETARCLFEPPAEALCLVFDLTGFALSNMEWNAARFIMRNFQANYPECLGTMIFHNAPWVFSGVWRITRGLLDPGVASKVHFTKDVEELEQWIPRENIAKRIGGADDWSYEFKEPAEEEDACIAHSDVREKIMAERREIADDLFRATRAWLEHTDANELEQIAAQQTIRKEAIEKLRINYWKLDPYVRSRTLLDRTGVIKPGGVIDHYPDRKTIKAEISHGELAVMDRESLGLRSREEVSVAS
ncbi:CRAL/TRIO domain protein [Biscogniauxia mediterranea]|nr:CRAL/TRIO domain protein [Biscogniauxia mediterranea]